MVQRDPEWRDRSFPGQLRRIETGPAQVNQRAGSLARWVTRSNDRLLLSILSRLLSARARFFFCAELAAPKRSRRAKVAFSYTAENEDELSLEPGQIVEIIEEEEEGWWRGSLNGKQGVFPSNFVEPILEDESTGQRPQEQQQQAESHAPGNLLANES